MFPDLKADVRADKADRTSLLIHGFWLGWIRIVLVGTTSSIHFLMKHVTVSEYASMSSSRRCPEQCPSPRDQKQSCSIASDWSDQQWTGPEGGCFTFSFLPISRQEQNGRVIRFAERWAGEGLACVPEGGVTMVECTSSTRVDGDVLKVFWS